MLKPQELGKGLGLVGPPCTYLSTPFPSNPTYFLLQSLPHQTHANWIFSDICKNSGKMDRKTASRNPRQVGELEQSAGWAKKKCIHSMEESFFEGKTPAHVTSEGDGGAERSSVLGQHYITLTRVLICI